MKKIIFAMAVLATVAVVSCQKEKDDEVVKVIQGENSISFTIPTAAKTKSADNFNYVGHGAIIPLGSEEDGNAFYLEETLEELDVASPVTKGTPVYTGNVGLLPNGDKLGVYSDELGAAQYVLASDKLVNGGWLYHHNYSGNPWDKADGDGYLHFYLRMPSDMTGVEDLDYAITDKGEQTISFSYTSPEKGEKQEDIIFATTKFTKSEYDSYFKGSYKGAPVLFRHALSGVKFATANHISGSKNGTKTYITKVKFTGLINGGSCVFTPSGTETISDNTSEYTSAGSMAWTPGEERSAFEQTFTTTNYAENIYDGSTLINETTAPGFFGEDKVSGVEGKKTTDWNINDKDASLTFWFVPQTLTDDVKLEVTFYIDAGGRIGNEVTKVIDFGKLTKYAEWQAGQLRTYILKANEVDVEITDDLEEGVKDNLKITNLGNVAQYVRATVIGYWADENGDAVFGYDESSVEGSEESGYTLKDNPKYVEPWLFSVETSNSPKYGTISTYMPGTSDSGWVVGKDDYFYYTNVIGVDEAATKVIFEQYKLTTTPNIYQIDQKTLQIKKINGVHLVMEVACQAVIAKEVSTTEYVAWNVAWKDALGYDPSAN